MKTIYASVLVIIGLIVVNNPNSIILFLLIGIGLFFLNKKNKKENENKFKKPNSWAENRESQN